MDAILISHKHADHMLDLLLYAGDAARSVLARRRPELYVPRVAPAARFDAAVALREYTAEQQLSIGSLSFSFAATDHEQPCFAARVSDGRTVVVYGADGAPSASLLALHPAPTCSCWRLRSPLMRRPLPDTATRPRHKRAGWRREPARRGCCSPTRSRAHPSTRSCRRRRSPSRVPLRWRVRATSWSYKVAAWICDYSGAPVST